MQPVGAGLRGRGAVGVAATVAVDLALQGGAVPADPAAQLSPGQVGLSGQAAADLLAIDDVQARVGDDGRLQQSVWRWVARPSWPVTAHWLLELAVLLAPSIHRGGVSAVMAA
jgi:hypothetical protein